MTTLLSKRDTRYICPVWTTPRHELQSRGGLVLMTAAKAHGRWSYAKTVPDYVTQQQEYKQTHYSFQKKKVMTSQ